jgi:hypothetical protein
MRRAKLPTYFDDMPRSREPVPGTFLNSTALLAILANLSR